jgi:hypothetical protein
MRKTIPEKIINDRAMEIKADKLFGNSRSKNRVIGIRNKAINPEKIKGIIMELPT